MVCSAGRSSFRVVSYLAVGLVPAAPPAEKKGRDGRWRRLGIRNGREAAGVAGSGQYGGFAAGRELTGAWRLKGLKRGVGSGGTTYKPPR